MFWNAFKLFFSSREDAKMNAKKRIELKDEWCEKSWEYERCLINIIDLLEKEKEDWIEYEKIEPLLDEANPFSEWFSAFSKKISSYKLQKSDFPWFEKVEEQNIIVHAYVHFKNKLNECYDPYWIIFNEEKEFLIQVDAFEWDWLYDFIDDFVVNKLSNFFIALRNLDKNIEEIKNDMNDLKNYVRDAHSEVVVLDRVNREFDFITNIRDIDDANTTKITKLYEEEWRRMKKS